MMTNAHLKNNPLSDPSWTEDHVCPVRVVLLKGPLVAGTPAPSPDMADHADDSKSDELNDGPVAKELPEGQLLHAELLHHVRGSETGNNKKVYIINSITILISCNKNLEQKRLMYADHKLSIT